MFDSINGARLAAKRVQRTHGAKSSLSREIVARAAGYRDNHHLETMIGRQGAPGHLMGPTEALAAYLAANAPGIAPEAVFALILPELGTRDAATLADRHPLLHGYGDFIRAARDFSGGPFEMWIDEDGIAMDVTRRLLGRDGRRAVATYCGCVEECMRSIFAVHDDMDGLYDRHVVALDEDGLTLEQVPLPLGPGGLQQYPGRRVRIPYVGEVVSEIMLVGTTGMPSDTATLNVWRNSHRPYSLDVLEVQAVRDDGAYTYYRVAHEDVTRMSHPERHDFGDVETGAGLMRTPLLDRFSTTAGLGGIDRWFDMVLPAPESHEAATRFDVARARRHFAGLGLEVPDDLATAWLAYPDDRGRGGYSRRLVSIRDMGEELTALEEGTGPHGITVISDRREGRHAVMWIGMDGQWRTEGAEHGAGPEGMSRALRAI